MWKKLSYLLILIFPLLVLLQSQTGIVKADSQSGYFDVTLTTNNGGGTTDPGGDGNGSGGGDQTTNGNNGGSNQTTKAPGSTTASQPKSSLSGLLPQTNNIQEGLLLGILVLITALSSWVMYLLIEAKKRGNENEKLN